MDTTIKQEIKKDFIPLNKRPPEEQREICRKGQQAMVKKVKAKRAVRDIIDDIFYSESTSKKEIKDKLIAKGLATNEIGTLLMQMVDKAGHNAHMGELLFKLHGDLQEGANVQVNVINQMSDEQIQAELNKLGGGGDAINITPTPPLLEE